MFIRIFAWIISIHSLYIITDWAVWVHPRFTFQYSQFQTTHLYRWWLLTQLKRLKRKTTIKIQKRPYEAVGLNEWVIEWAIQQLHTYKHNSYSISISNFTLYPLLWAFYILPKKTDSCPAIFTTVVYQDVLLCDSQIVRFVSSSLEHLLWSLLPSSLKDSSAASYLSLSHVKSIK